LAQPIARAWQCLSLNFGACDEIRRLVLCQPIPRFGHPQKAAAFNCCALSATAPDHVIDVGFYTEFEEALQFFNIRRWKNITIDVSKFLRISADDLRFAE
jgi:hypothetical protein